MSYFINFANPFTLRDKTGVKIPHKCIGPFASESDAQRWMLRYRAVLESAGAVDAVLVPLSDPANM
jgi:hypothetical protein